MKAWHRVGLESAREHPLYGRGGWLAFWFVDLGLLLALILVYAVFLVLVSYYEYPDGDWVAYLLSLLVTSAVAAFLAHTLYIGFRRIPAPEGGSRFDERFPRRIKLLVGLLLLFGIYNFAFGPGGSSDGELPVTLNSVINAIIFFLYFENSRRVRISYLNQVLASDPLLETAEIIDAETLTPEMVRDRHLLAAVMNPVIPPDIRADIRNKWADDAERGRLSKKARDYMIEIHEAYLGPYTPHSA